MVARIEYRSILTALVVSLVAALFLALLPRLPEQVFFRVGALGPLIAEGETTQIRSFYGFHEVETAGDFLFRWTDGLGNFVVRNGERLGTPLLLRMRLCGCRGDVVKQLLVRVNGVSQADLASSATRPGWRHYAMLLPPRTTEYSPDLLVELISDTIANPQYGYQMGVALDSVELSPATSQRAYGPLYALVLGLAIGLAGLAAPRTKNKEQRTKGPENRERAPAGSTENRVPSGRTEDRGSRIEDSEHRSTRSPAHPLTRSPAHLLTRSPFRRAGGWSVVGGPWSVVAIGLVAAQGLLYRRQALPAEVLACCLLLALGVALRVRAAAWTTALLVLLLGALVLAPQILGSWILDDAYISFRYARNALAGDGFVFNPGERVEGYTNFLWTALFVPLLGMGLDPAPAAQAITLLLALATGALCWMVAQRLAGPIAALGALALLASSAPFVLYAARGSGMETALFTLLVLAAVCLYEEQRTKNKEQKSRRESSIEDRRWKIEDRRSSNAPMLCSILYPLSSLFTRSPAHPLTRSSSLGVLLALAAMTRPEGMLVAAVCGLHLLATSWLAGRVAWRRLLGLALGFLAIFGPYYLWRFGYYGYPLPNTFYAKVGGTVAQVQRGLGYAAAFAASQAPLVVIALVGLLPLKNKEPGVEDGGWRIEDSRKSAPAVRRSLSRRLTRSPVHPFTRSPQRSFLWLLVGVYTLYIVAVGGDHFPLFRFFVPLLPPLALLGGLALGRLGRLLPPIVAASASTLLVAAAIGWQAPQLYESRTLNGQSGVWTENTVVEKNREIGLWLRDNTAPGTLIGTGIAGALPFYAERPVLDMLGLNDLHIAHMEAPTIGQGVAGSEKTDNDYILRRRPDYIPYNSAGTLFEVPQFLELYERGIVHGPEGRWLRLYKRRDLAAPPGWIALDSQ